MKRPPSLPALVMLALFVHLASCDCARRDNDWPIPDTIEDPESDAVEETVPDASDVPGEDDPDAAGDALEEDATAVERGRPFHSETAGGERISTELHTIELFLAPVRPTAITSNDSYTVVLGPAGMRRP